MAEPEPPAPPSEVTVLLQQLGGGDAKVANELARLVYDELHRIADRAMRGERPDHTLQPTLLVSDAFLKLVGHRDAHWQNRAQFYAVAAQAIRRILVDHARARQRVKRNFGLRVTLDDSIAEAPEPALDVLAIDEALARLEAAAPRQAQIVELRYFGGLDIDATAEALGISPATVKRDWTFARAFMLRELQASR
ncbi:ECF-type sigma factor [Nevskia ramosa]|uniref:ECF-type sigma factor n=1 Tax=Nevskia ramosa TaxID=64002 RepID=UPI0003B42E4E|nr:ECF-type sigma factor [Nevskia ramosa]